MPQRRSSSTASESGAGFLFGLLMLLVVLTPLPLGANREWAWTMAANLVGVLGVLTALHLAWRGSRVLTGGEWAVLALFTAVFAWAGLQSSSLTPVTWHHPAWELASAALGEPLAGSVSLSPDDTRTACMRLLAYGVVFALAYRLASDAERARRGLQWLAYSGAVYAMYGLWVYGSGSGTVLWLQHPGWINDVRGTFVNHNHFATWTGLSLLCALSLVFLSATLRRNPAYQLPLDAGARLEAFLSRCWKPLVALLLLTAALVLSHSRGGFLSTCAAVGVLLACAWWRRPLRRGALRLALSLVAVGMAIVIWVSSDVLVQRMDRLTADYQSRVNAYALTLEGIEDNPVVGFGYGAFLESMRLYRDERIEGLFDRAHNSYLEAIMGLGWPASVVLGLCLLLPIWGCLTGLRKRRRGWIYSATGLAATMLAGAHALVDFSLQIPAVAFAYAVIMGIACAQSRSPSEPDPLVYTSTQLSDVTGRPV